MNNNVNQLDDARTFPRASKAAQAGIKWLIDNASDWAPGGRLSADEAVLFHFSRLFQVTRAWLATPEQMVPIYEQRLRGIDTAIDALKKEMAATAASRGSVNAEKDVIGFPRVVPRGKTAEHWIRQCEAGIEALEIIRGQTLVAMRGQKAAARRMQIDRERDLFLILFDIFADLSQRLPEQVGLSATSGPRTYAMNFILAVVSELTDKPPSLDTIRRRIKGGNCGTRSRKYHSAAIE